MIDAQTYPEIESKNLFAVADFELRSFGADYNESDHPQITQTLLKESA